MSWNSSREALKNQPQGGMWFKMDPDQKLDASFMGEPMEVMEKSDWAPDGTLRFQMNVFSIAAGVMQVWSMSGRVFARVLSLHEEGQIDGCKITIKRRGSGKDTAYDLFFKGDVAPQDMRRATKMRLHDLPSGDDTVAVEHDEAEDPGFTDDDIGDAIDALIGEFGLADSPDRLKSIFATAWKANKKKPARARLKTGYDAALAKLIAMDSDDDEDCPF